MWLSLTGFVKWLGRTGQCVVDDTEKGWYVTYIDRDPETLAAQEKKAKKEKLDKDDEERLMDFIGKQIEKGKQEISETEETKREPLNRCENDAPITFEMKLKPKVKPLSSYTPSTSKLNLFKKSKDIDNGSKKSKQPEVGKDNERILKKIKPDPDLSKLEGWLKEGLMVKVVTKRLGEEYYKGKGIIQGPVKKPNFVAKVKLKTPREVEGSIVKLDQEHLETIIPAIGRDILILWGEYKGMLGVVKKLHIDEYSVDIELKEQCRVIKKLPYEQVCKYVG